MPIYHTIAFHLSSPHLVPDLVTDFTSTLQACIKPCGTHYISSIKGGGQMQVHDHGGGWGWRTVAVAVAEDSRVIYTLEFRDEEDLRFFVNQDPAHIMFKIRSKTELGVRTVEVMTFDDGVYVQTRKLSL